MSQQYQKSLDFVLKWEGSAFTNDPADHGGATRYGVTQRVYDAYRKQLGKGIQSVRFITADEVRSIYRRNYWDAVEGDRMPAPVDTVLLDTGVLMGVSRAIKLLQASANVGIDGVIGPDTRAAVAAADALSLAATILHKREQRLRAIVDADPSQKKFLKGWLNRLNALRKLIGVAVPKAVSGESEEANPEEAVGRADRELPTDQEEFPETLPEEGLPLMTAVVAEAFLANARRLRCAASGALYVLDTEASTEQNLRAYHPSAALDSPFEIPTQVVETITPFGIFRSSPARIIAAVTFRPEFGSLENTFARLGSPGGGPAEWAADGPLGAGFAGDRCDWDPAAPFSEAEGFPGERSVERMLANLGSTSANAETGREEASAAAFPFPTMPLEMATVEAFLQACMTSSPRVTYGLGKKVPFHGAVPGKDFQKVDCSGFVREAIHLATTPHVPFPDGSVVQHDWVRHRGFKKSTVDAAMLRDGAVRIAFLRPQDARSGVGHVALVQNGATFESHGGVGPDSRVWAGGGWQAKAHVYVLTAPSD